jgi:hypothetical protein
MPTAMSFLQSAAKEREAGQLQASCPDDPAVPGLTRKCQPRGERRGGPVRAPRGEVARMIKKSNL